jgi:methionine synthase / methylenetetrahydrofolate reductase(NADPH)
MYDRTRHLNIAILTGVLAFVNRSRAEFLHHEVPGIIIPDAVRTRMAGKEGQEGRRPGIEIEKGVAEAALECFPGVYLITPFLAYDAAKLARFLRSLSS